MVRIGGGSSMPIFFVPHELCLLASSRDGRKGVVYSFMCVWI